MTRTPSSRKLLSLLDLRDLGRVAAFGALVSAALSCLALTAPIYLTQLYERVIPTGNGPTLAVLTIAALLAIGMTAAFEQIRSVLFARIAASIYVDLETLVYWAGASDALAAHEPVGRSAFDDLESIRSLIVGPAPSALLDLIFAPLLLIALFYLHVWVGVFAMAALGMMIAAAALTQWASRGPMRRASNASAQAARSAETGYSAIEAAAAMGFGKRLFDQWAQSSRAAVESQMQALARSSRFAAASRALKASAQITIMALATLLVLDAGVTVAAIFASSVILARLLSPADVILGQWRILEQARLASSRLSALLQRPLALGPGHGYAAPTGPLTIENLSAASASGRALLRNVSFKLNPGETLAVVGPVGSGKSSLLRAVLGLLPHISAPARLGGAAILPQRNEALGARIGFLPQDPQLLEGSVAENIRRHGPDDPEGVKAAVAAARLDDLIAALPQGLKTEVGPHGSALSAGQKRRVALARALYGAPLLVCLDEPEAHQDQAGEAAVSEAIAALKAHGAIVLIAAHRPSIVGAADWVMVLAGGAVAQYGRASDVLAPIAPPSFRAAAS
jgi:ATP-binding cassette subfamily C protein